MAMMPSHSTANLIASMRRLVLRLLADERFVGTAIALQSGLVQIKRADQPNADNTYYQCLAAEYAAIQVGDQVAVEKFGPTWICMGKIGSGNPATVAAGGTVYGGLNVVTGTLTVPTGLRTVRGATASLYGSQVPSDNSFIVEAGASATAGSIVLTVYTKTYAVSGVATPVFWMAYGS